MHFTKLRLSGFKSFVEPTEFLIEPGLTGIVGPNGCGKSNLVEALQWVMGETSARRLRGGEMDDVIFGGAVGRPARNLATVTLWLDNSDRTAPAQINDQDELEIERRIDRDRGSTYRVNSREMRARDVQILFADAASGAHSSALVGQGRIGWLINARPAERRTLLEEAAGIGGLQARRHEAELRLNATEQNVTRLQDVAATLMQQIDRLKRQVRQAERYRGLTEAIRRAEAMALHLHLADGTTRLTEAVRKLRATSATAEHAEQAAEAAMAERLAAADIVPPLRDAHAELMRHVDALTLDIQAAVSERRAVLQRIDDLRQRLAQTDQDVTREIAQTAEADQSLARLAAERETLEARAATDMAAQTQASTASREAQEQVRAAETALTLATSRLTQAETARAAIRRQIATIEERRQRLCRQRADAEARSRETDLLSISPERLAAAAASVTDAETTQETARQSLTLAEQALRDRQTEESAVLPKLRAAEQARLTLRAEIQALEKLVHAGSGGGVQPILDHIEVHAGYETALGAALGDDLLAGLDASSVIHWADLEKTEEGSGLPEDMPSLLSVVTAPSRMARRLAQIGLVEDAAQGARLQTSLLAGQRLVSRDGALWRWDGLRIAAGAPTSAAIRLSQRNRLAELRHEADGAEILFLTAQSEHTACQKAVEAARNAERATRDTLRDSGQKIAAARAAEASLIQQAGAADARRQAAFETLRRVAADEAETDLLAQDAALELERLPEPVAEREAIATHRTEAENRRRRERGLREEVERLMRDAASRQARLAAVTAEAHGWQGRIAAAFQRRATLEERRGALQTELAALEIVPADLANLQESLEADRSEVQNAVKRATARLTEAETEARAGEHRQIAAAQAQAEARASLIRAESTHEQAVETRRAVIARIAAAFDCGPDDLPFAADAQTESASLAEIESGLEKLKRDRDAIGPVNLMAETELASLTAELDTNQAESADLNAAIARLRQGIQELNRESRGRLLAAFERVNTHFRDLFSTLFGGGVAYLELVNHENDPLQAGLEIMASPPGKKMQILSLLSGGERALTALALVFAMFLTNPAPICVLDEVDAPLDDANVERFCRLVREMSERTGTRFLIVTHHRVSMARVDRLYGVTMIEKGVSRLVSVDLGEAERLRPLA